MVGLLLVVCSWLHAGLLSGSNTFTGCPKLVSPKRPCSSSAEVSEYVIMLPAQFGDVDGSLSDHNVGKIFGLFKILKAMTLCFTRNLSTRVFHVGSSDTLTYCKKLQ